MENPIVIGIDAGGTMTDTILVDQNGHFKIGKAATTPKNEAEGFISSAADAADAWGISLDSLFSGLDVVLYSGTGMLNTLLSRTGRKLGLITTKGLEDMVLMGRGLQGPGPTIPMPTGSTPSLTPTPIRWCRAAAPMASQSASIISEISSCPSTSMR
ncbi:N-methylhydantoinase A/oxoprolinase/acetone carboxylase beta subunit [Sinorhizobium medicae]